MGTSTRTRLLAAVFCVSLCSLGATAEWSRAQTVSVKTVIVELGSHDELVAQGGRYADMYATWEAHASGERIAAS